MAQPLGVWTYASTPVPTNFQTSIKYEFCPLIFYVYLSTFLERSKQPYNNRCSTRHIDVKYTLLPEGVSHVSNVLS